MRFNDAVEVVEFGHQYSWKAAEGLLRPPYNCKGGEPVNPYTDSNRRQWMRSAANARRRAFDLAEGVGAICDPEDIDEFVCAKGGVRDDRRRPLVWEDSFCLIYTEPADGIASYGRFPHPIDCKFIPRSAAIMEFRPLWHKYQHFGDVPESTFAGPAKPILKRTVKAMPMPVVAATSPQTMPTFKMDVATPDETDQSSTVPEMPDFKLTDSPDSAADRPTPAIAQDPQSP